MFYIRPGSVPRWKEEVVLPDFSLSSLCYLTPSFFYLYVQRLTQDVTDMAELQEEVTRARVTAVMIGTHAAQAERMAQERTVLLATARGEASEAAKRVSALESELVAAHWARDTAKGKIPRLAKKWTRPNDSR
jgi:hypothetical protein